MIYKKLIPIPILCAFLIINHACTSEKSSGNVLIPYEKTGELKVKNSSEITSSPFGIQAGTLVDTLVARAAEIGVKWTRLGISWPSVEEEKGVYDWSSTDKAIDVALKNGITPFMYIGGGNQLYSRMSTYDDPKLAAIYGSRPEPPIKDPVAMKAFLAFVEAAATRYKDKIDYWEVWNEPNHRNYWGAEPDGKEYGNLLVLTASVIRQIDPDCKIIGGSMAGIDPDFTDDFLSVGSAGLIDIISYHNYGSVPETRVYKAIELWEVINSYKPEIELWQGECGYPSHSSSRDFRGRAPWGLNIQAKWLLRQAFVDTYFCNATLSNYFKLVNPQGKGEKQKRENLRPIDEIFGFPERGGSRVRTKGVNEKCLLTNPEFDEKPGYYAYQNLCSLWEPDYKPVKAAYQITVTDQGIFYGIGEEDDAFPSIPLVASFKTTNGDWLIAWWLPWTMQEYLPELARIEIEIDQVQFDDPVLIDPLTGEVYDFDGVESEVGRLVIRNVPLADYPLIMVERETLEM